MPAGSFSVTINPEEVADIDGDDGGQLSVYFQGGATSAVIAGDLKTLDRWARPVNLAPAVSEGYVLTLPTNVASGGSVSTAEVAYDLTWASAGARVQAAFPAQPDGSTVLLSNLVADSDPPVIVTGSALIAEMEAIRDATVTATGVDGAAAAAVNTNGSALRAALKGRDLMVNVKDYGAVGDGATDDGQAIDDALVALKAAIPFVKRIPSLWFPAGVYVTNRQHAADFALTVAGPGRLSSIIRIGATFPSGGTIFTFTYASSTSVPNLESHVPGLSFTGVTLDGDLRSKPAHAIKLHRFNRVTFRDFGVNSFDGSALISTHSLGESRIDGLYTWLCGNDTSPVIDLDQTYDGTAEGHNLNHFRVELMYCIGDMVRVRGGSGVSVRYQKFTQSTLHGLEEWIDDYYDMLGRPITLTHEGAVSARVVIDNARGIKFHQTRMRQQGRGQPSVLLSNRSAGGSTSNSTNIAQSDLTFRGGTYSTRTLGTVNTTADTLQVVGVNTSRHHLQTGSRVRFVGTSLPAPLAQGTDYYAIRTNATSFKVATSRANAAAGTAVDLTGSGSGTVTQFETAVTVDTTADTLTALDHRLTTGARFRVTGTAPGGLATGTDYFTIRVDKDTLKLATTRANAEAGTAIDLTSAGADVSLAPQDFLADIESGTVTFDGNVVDAASGGVLSRGYFRAESGASVVIGPTNTWSAGTSAPVAEYATGIGQPINIPGTLVLLRNNEGTYLTRTDGVAVLAMRMTAANAVQFGSLSGSDNASLVGAGVATVVGGGSERFRAGAGGLSFNGVTTLVARRTVNAAATDAATTQALANQLRQLLVDLGIAQ